MSWFSKLFKKEQQTETYESIAALTAEVEMNDEFYSDEETIEDVADDNAETVCDVDTNGHNDCEQHLNEVNENDNTTHETKTEEHCCISNDDFVKIFYTFPTDDEFKNEYNNGTTATIVHFDKQCLANCTHLLELSDSCKHKMIAHYNEISVVPENLLFKMNSCKSLIGISFPFIDYETNIITYNFIKKFPNIKVFVYSDNCDFPDNWRDYADHAYNGNLDFIY